MDALYSVALLLALTAGLTASALALAAPALRARRPDGHGEAKARKLSISCALAALSFGAASAGVHARFGHGPGSQEPMQWVAFFQAHRACWWLLPLVLIPLLAGARR